MKIWCKGTNKVAQKIIFVQIFCLSCLIAKNVFFIFLHIKRFETKTKQPFVKSRYSVSQLYMFGIAKGHL